MKTATNPPTDAKARLQSAYKNLQRGIYEPGWAEYEARFVVNGNARDLPQPLWRGERLDGKSILVHREQGIGDEIWFAACYPDLVELGARCTFTCDERLAALYRRSFPSSVVVPAATGVADWKSWREHAFDYQVPAGNVCRYLRREAASFGRRRSYLAADPVERSAWRARFDALGRGPKIGISWQGGIDLLSLRQAPWETWHALLATPGVHFVNLQYGDARPVLDVIRDRWGITVHDWPEIDPLLHLDAQAAQIAALDAVITVPNTTTHLASALGVPVWVLFTPEWGCFWIVNGESLPWYPTAEVFARSRSSTWDDVVARLRARMHALCERDACC